MNLQDVLQTVLPVIDALERLGIAYRIGGSVASSHYGRARQTQDIDLIADIPVSQAPALVAALDPHQYLVDLQAVVDAIRHQSSFNIIDQRSMYKVDIFIQPHTPLAQQEQQRAQQVTLAPGTRPVWMATVEDTIVQKLRWWQLGGGISTRQWRDIVDLIQTNAAILDRGYLQATASALGVSSPLQQAFADAGVPFP